MNRIKPGCIPEDDITWEGTRSKQNNITNFLTKAEEYGVPKEKLFFPEDLLHLRHIPRVTRCIYALAKIVFEFIIFDMNRFIFLCILQAQADPKLGDEVPQLGDEPNFVKPTKKVDMPGHRDTRDVLNQLTAKKDDAKKQQTKHSLYK